MDNANIADKMARLQILFDVPYFWHATSYDMILIARAIVTGKKAHGITRGGAFWKNQLSHSIRLWEAVSPYIDFSPNVRKSIDEHFEQLAKSKVVLSGTN